MSSPAHEHADSNTDIDLNADINTHINIDTDVYSDINANADTHINVNSDTDAYININTNADCNCDVDHNIDTCINVNINADAGGIWRAEHFNTHQHTIRTRGATRKDLFAIDQKRLTASRKLIIFSRKESTSQIRFTGVQ